SGHLNIVNDQGELFGVTINNGYVVNVDSSDSQANAILTLISNGFLNQEDFDEFQRDGNRKFTIEHLIQEGLVSPHAVAQAKLMQCLADLKTICQSSSMHLNFSLSETVDTSAN